MKRFLLFGFMEYDAEGGMGDFVGDFDTLEEAKEGAKNTDKRFQHLVWINSIVEIWDCQERKQVWSNI